MTVDVYLKEEVRELPGFKIGHDNVVTLNGMRVFGFGEENNRLHIMWNKKALIPDELADFVKEVSCYDTIPRMGYRESGIYRHESAQCELIPIDNGSFNREKLAYGLGVTAKNMEDLKAILHLVKTGRIRPKESYDCPQDGKTREQLESELMQTQQLLKEATATIERLSEELRSATALQV